MYFSTAIFIKGIKASEDSPNEDSPVELVGKRNDSISAHVWFRMFLNGNQITSHCLLEQVNTNYFPQHS